MVEVLEDSDDTSVTLLRCVAPCLDGTIANNYCDYPVPGARQFFPRLCASQ